MPTTRGNTIKTRTGNCLQQNLFLASYFVLIKLDSSSLARAMPTESATKLIQPSAHSFRYWNQPPVLPLQNQQSVPSPHPFTTHPQATGPTRHSHHHSPTCTPTLHSLFPRFSDSKEVVKLVAPS
jgi:hypothetical protein